MAFTNSPNMGMPIPNVLNELGPQYATDVNQCLNLIDGHGHGPGIGNAPPIGAQGIALQGDLSFNINNAINMRTVRFISTTATSGTDIGCVYVKGVDLYYNDLNANQVRLTNNGGIATSSTFIGQISTTAVISAAGPTPATSGFIRMNNATDFVAWRNAANIGDDKIFFDASDNFNIIGGGIVGEGQGARQLQINPTSGILGEYLFTSLLPTSSVSFPQLTYEQLLSLNLSIGDWNIDAKAVLASSTNSATVSSLIMGISQYSSGQPDLIGALNQFTIQCAPSQLTGTSISNYRLSTSASTNIYLFLQANLPGGGAWSIPGNNSQCGASLAARRMR